MHRNCPGVSNFPPLPAGSKNRASIWDSSLAKFPPVLLACSQPIVSRLLQFSFLAFTSINRGIRCEELSSTLATRTAPREPEESAPLRRPLSKRLGNWGVIIRHRFLCVPPAL